MGRKHFRIRRWLALAAALVTLSLASSASAMVAADGGGGAAAYPQSPTVTTPTSGGFNWGDAAVGAGIALGVAFSGAGVLRITGSRRRLAGLLQ